MGGVCDGGGDRAAGNLSASSQGIYSRKAGEELQAATAAVFSSARRHLDPTVYVGITRVQRNSAQALPSSCRTPSPPRLCALRLCRPGPLRISAADLPFSIQTLDSPCLSFHVLRAIGRNRLPNPAQSVLLVLPSPRILRLQHCFPISNTAKYLSTQMAAVSQEMSRFWSCANLVAPPC